jgi:hypothetical protein
MTNHLTKLAQMFTFAPSRDKLEVWARELVLAGFKESQLKPVCATMTRSFERYPTLSQIFEFIRPRSSSGQSIERDPQAIKDQTEYERIKIIWCEKLGADILNKMCQSYAKNVLMMNIGALSHYGIESTWIEMLVLLDWKRCGFNNAEAILNQGKISQSKFNNNGRVNHEEM